jgi:23S rRNA (pseudouridine1915-N3)-methyltransferase
MQITVISVGTIKESYLRDALQEYNKRIGTYAILREISIPESRITNEDDPKQVAAALSQDGEAILSRIPTGAYKVALCVEGKQFSSEELAKIVGEARDGSGKLVLIIGSSHGLAPTVKAACDLRLSVSKLTFPHQLMRVILSESLYRSLTILAGKKYHK